MFTISQNLELIMILKFYELPRVLTNGQVILKNWAIVQTKRAYNRYSEGG